MSYLLRNLTNCCLVSQTYLFWKQKKTINNSTELTAENTANVSHADKNVEKE